VTDINAAISKFRTIVDALISSTRRGANFGTDYPNDFRGPLNDQSPAAPLNHRLYGFQLAGAELRLGPEHFFKQRPRAADSVR
jgi:hypothetical protein